MMLDIEAISHDKLDRLEPCVCGCRSFHLDEETNWQCSRCKPPPTGAVRFELDDPPPISDQDGDSEGTTLLSNSEEDTRQIVLQRLERKIAQVLNSDAPLRSAKSVAID